MSYEIEQALQNKSAGRKLGDNPLQPRRHIYIDNIHNVIFIQVMYRLNGDIIEQEYYDLVNGLWHKYVPAGLIQQIRDAISAQYKVMPFVMTGMANEDYYITQVIDLKQKGIIGG